MKIAIVCRGQLCIAIIYIPIHRARAQEQSHAGRLSARSMISLLCWELCLTLLCRSTTDNLAMNTLLVTGLVTSIVFVGEAFRMSRIWPDYWHSLEVLGNVDHSVNQKMSKKSSRWILRSV